MSKVINFIFNKNKIILKSVFKKITFKIIVRYRRSRMGGTYVVSVCIFIMRKADTASQFT